MTKTIQEAIEEVRRKSLVEQEPPNIVKKSQEIEDQIRQSGLGQVTADVLKQAGQKAREAERDVDTKLLGYEYKREDPTAPVKSASKTQSKSDQTTTFDPYTKSGKTEVFPVKQKKSMNENDSPLIDAFLRLHELTPFERKFAQEMKRQGGPGERKTFDWNGTKIALKYATDKPKPAAARPARPAPAAPAAAQADSASKINSVKVRPVTAKFGDDDRMNAFINPEKFANKKLFVPGEKNLNVLDTTEKTPPAEAPAPAAATATTTRGLAAAPATSTNDNQEVQVEPNKNFQGRIINLNDKQSKQSAPDYSGLPGFFRFMRDKIIGTQNEQTDYVNPPGKLRMPKDMTGGQYQGPTPGRPLRLPKDIAKAQPPVEVRPSDPERLKKPVATIPFQMKEYLDRTSGKPPMKEDVSSTVKDLYNRAKEAITGSSKGDRVTPKEPERSTEIFKAEPGSKQSFGMSDYPGKNIGQGNKFSNRVPKDDDKPMSGISPAPKPMSGISPAPKPKFDYQNRQYQRMTPHQTGKGRAIDSNRETYLEQKSAPDEGKRKKMSEENSPIIDMFLKLQEKNALNPNIFEAAKKMSAKEKSLASLGHPRDKITKKDVLIGRGVLPKEVDEASIYSGKNPFAPGGPNSPIGPGGSENFGRAVTVEKEPKPARPADSAKPKSFVDPKNPTVQGSGDITFDGRPTRVKEGMEDIEAPKYRSAEDVKKAKQPNGYEYKFDTDTKSTFERMRGLSGKDAKVMEELKGNQHRIDANKNGKIDAHDFKLLRSKKKVEEEVEEIDEISVGTAYSYASKKMEKEREGLLQGERNPTSKLQLKNMTNAANRTDKDYYKQRGFKKMGEEVEDDFFKPHQETAMRNAKKLYTTGHLSKPGQTVGHPFLSGNKHVVVPVKNNDGQITHHYHEYDHKDGYVPPQASMSKPSSLFTEEVEFSQAEIDHINSFFEAVAPNRAEPTKGVNPTVRNTDLTDENLDELKKPTPETALKVVNRANDRDEWSAKAANRLYSRYKKGYEPKEKKTEVKEEQIEEGRPRKNPTPETTERDARQHIQVQAGRAAGGTVIDFKHDDGKISKLTPGMGRRITAHLNGLKPAERQEAVKRMHASPEGLKV